MKKLIALAVLGWSLGFSGAAFADCTLTDPPAVPDGKTASEADMVAAQQAVKSYVAVTQEYLACLEFESKGRSGGDWTRKYNQAAEQMEKLATQFNRELKAFKSR